MILGLDLLQVHDVELPWILVKKCRNTLNLGLNSCNSPSVYRFHLIFVQFQSNIFLRSKSPSAYANVARFSRWIISNIFEFETQLNY